MPTRSRSCEPAGRTTSRSFPIALAVGSACALLGCARDARPNPRSTLVAVPPALGVATTVFRSRSRSESRGSTSRRSRSSRRRESDPGASSMRARATSRRPVDDDFRSRVRRQQFSTSGARQRRVRLKRRGAAARHGARRHLWRTRTRRQWRRVRLMTISRATTSGRTSATTRGRATTTVRRVRGRDRHLAGGHGRTFERAPAGRRARARGGGPRSLGDAGSARLRLLARRGGGERVGPRRGR